MRTLFSALAVLAVGYWTGRAVTNKLRNADILKIAEMHFDDLGI